MEEPRVNREQPEVGEPFVRDEPRFRVDFGQRARPEPEKDF